MRLFGLICSPLSMFYDSHMDTWDRRIRYRPSTDGYFQPNTKFIHRFRMTTSSGEEVNSVFSG
jgi:hypothetical protein